MVGGVVTGNVSEEICLHLRTIEKAQRDGFRFVLLFLSILTIMISPTLGKDGVVVVAVIASAVFAFGTVKLGK